MLVIVLYTVVSRGGSAISWDFLTTIPAPFGQPGGGIAPYILGTLLLVAVATVIAMPLGC